MRSAAVFVCDQITIAVSAHHTAGAQRKPATLETGLVVQVPAFVNEGEVIRITTEDGAYLERVK